MDKDQVLQYIIRCRRSETIQVIGRIGPKPANVADPQSFRQLSSSIDERFHIHGFAKDDVAIAISTTEERLDQPGGSKGRRKNQQEQGHDDLLIAFEEAGGHSGLLSAWGCYPHYR